MQLLNRASWVRDTVQDHLWLLRAMRIGDSDLVLDVGSGGSPNIRSNVLCDKFVADGSERGGQHLVADRPFVVADVQHLPFADRSFDFVICSHLLEHIEDPGAAIDELQRVAPRGYIETPSAGWEKLQGFPFHRWLVSLDDGVLHFHQKPSPLWDGELKEWFASLQALLGIERKLWFARRKIGIYTSLLWEGEISYEIHAAPARSAAPDFHSAGLIDGDGAPPPRGKIASKLIGFLGEHVRRHSDRSFEEIEGLLRCPACLSRLDKENGDYRCARCAARYGLDAHGHPWLLVDGGSG